VLADLFDALRRWRLIHLIGVSNLRGRYARSRVGQLWVTVANAIFIIAIGTIWSWIWRMDIDRYLPYVGAGFVIYVFLSQCINESASVLVADSRIFMNDRRPFILAILAMIYRNLIILAHNVPIIICLVLWSDSARFAPDWRLIPAVLLSVTFLVFFCYGLSIVCARFRDLIQIVNLIVQVSFLLTPVMWYMRSLPEKHHVWLYVFNPIAAILEVLRDPLIGETVATMPYISLAGWAAAAVSFGLGMHRIFGRRIIFWL
jgi:lipopolysaccharide transport system permease protein